MIENNFFILEIKQQFLPRKVEQQIVLDRCANAFMAAEHQSSPKTVQEKSQPSKQKPTEVTNQTPPPSPVKPSLKPLNMAEISTPPNMTR